MTSSLDIDMTFPSQYHIPFNNVWRTARPHTMHRGDCTPRRYTIITFLSCPAMGVVSDDDDDEDDDDDGGGSNGVR